MAEAILIYGAGGHGRALVELVRALPAWRLVGLVDDAPGALPQLGLPLLGDAAVLSALRGEGVAAAVIAIGDPAARRAVAVRLLTLGFCLPVLAHPSAVLASSATIAEGTVVLPRVVLGAAARVGRLCILNTGAIIEHDAVLEDACHIGPGAVLAGGVTVGQGALIGAGAACAPGMSIGPGATVGTGAAVVTAVDVGETVVGVPAKRISE